MKQCKTRLESHQARPDEQAKGNPWNFLLGLFYLISQRSFGCGFAWLVVVKSDVFLYHFVCVCSNVDNIQSGCLGLKTIYSWHTIMALTIKEQFIVLLK